MGASEGKADRNDKGAGMAALIKQLVKRASDGDYDTKETSAAMLCSLGLQNHFEHSDALFDAGTVPPLVRILATGSAKAQGHAASALFAIAHGKPEHQTAIVQAGAVPMLVKLIKTGSAKVQEEVRVWRAHASP